MCSKNILKIYPLIKLIKQLNILNSNNNITIGNISFDKEGELYIGGNTYFQDTTINNDGIISIAGALILSGNTTITGTGIII